MGNAEEVNRRWVASKMSAIARPSGFISRDQFSLDLRRNSKVTSEFFHCCIFADNFTSLSTVQSYLCGD